MGFLNDPKSRPKWFSAAEIAEAGYHPYMNGATLAWHSDVFRSFAALDRRRLGAAYDHVLPFRAAVLKGSYYTAELLVQRRIHGEELGEAKIRPYSRSACSRRDLLRLRLRRKNMHAGRLESTLLDKAEI